VFTPFVDTSPPVSPVVASVARLGISSPFLTQYELEGTPAAAADPSVRAYHEVLEALHDEAFDEAVHELVGELSALAGERRGLELGKGASSRIERMLEEHLAPLARDAEELIRSATEALAPFDLASASESELDEALEPFAPTGAASPSFENFLGGLWKKIKGAAKGAWNLAQKGVQAVSSVVLGPVLKQLGKLVRPLLQKVVTTLVDKLPPQLQPFAAQAAQKIGGLLPSGFAPKAPPPPSGVAQSAGDGGAGGESSDASSADAAPAVPADPAAADVGQTQAELDHLIAESLVRGAPGPETVEREFPARAYRLPAADPLSELEDARERFVDELISLGEGEDAGPAVEHFLPALLGAVQLGVKLIGRPRVVGFLANLIGGLLRPVVGAQTAPTLGQAIADVGLRTLFNAEVDADDARRAAGEALTSTVEETVRRVSALPAHALDDETLLEAATLEAFENAAAANFPASLVRPELRESANHNGVWVGMPVTMGETPKPPARPAEGRCYYKKFSQVFDVTVTPAIARTVRTFGGGTLDGFMRDRLGAVLRGPVRARMHLYRIEPGGRLTHVSRFEQVRGLAATDAWRSLLPLTPHAASVLLHEPRLGRRLLAPLDPLRPHVGQRVYFLEMEGASPVRLRGMATRMHVKVDFGRDEIVACVDLSARIAREIAALLDKRARPSLVLNAIRAAVAPHAATHHAHHPGHLRLVGLPPSVASAPPGVRHALLHQLRGQVTEWTWARLAEYFTRSAAEFLGAAEGARGGVAVAVTFHRPAGMRQLAAALGGAPTGAMHEWPPAHPPEATVRVVPEHRH